MTTSRLPLISTESLQVQPQEKVTTTVVFFLGGCTYTEIAALRWVGRQNLGLCFQEGVAFLIDCAIGRRFLIVTTNIISGGSIIDSIAGLGKSPAAGESKPSA